MWNEQTKAVGENMESTIKTFKNLLPVMFKRIFLEEAGINLLAGTVSEWFMGAAFKKNWNFLADAGLKPPEALQTATVNPTKFLDQEEKSGTVAIGKKADLVLLNSNPLEDMSNTQNIFYGDCKWEDYYSE